MLRSDSGGQLLLPVPLRRSRSPRVELFTSEKEIDLLRRARYAIWQGDVEHLLSVLPNEPIFDLVVTSPPYNLGKVYEKRRELEEYLAWQEKIIEQVVSRVRVTGSVCWQVGNFVDNGQIVPLDIGLALVCRGRAFRLADYAGRVGFDHSSCGPSRQYAA